MRGPAGVVVGAPRWRVWPGATWANADGGFGGRAGIDADWRAAGPPRRPFTGAGAGWVERVGVPRWRVRPGATWANVDGGFGGRAGHRRRLAPAGPPRRPFTAAGAAGRACGVPRWRVWPGATWANADGGFGGEPASTGHRHRRPPGLRRWRRHRHRRRRRRAGAGSDSLRADPPLARGCPSWGYRSRCPAAGPGRRSRPSSRPG